MSLYLRRGAWLVLGVLSVLLSACSTPAVDPSRRTGYEKERTRLAQSVRGVRLAVSGSYSGDKYTGNVCEHVVAARKIETEVNAWGVSPVPWAQRRPDDAALTYRWTCEFPYTDKSGASAFGSLLTLGALPVFSTYRLKLEVSIDRNGKTLFKNQYVEQRDVATNLWSPQYVERYLDMADVLIEKFVKELERDGALEP